MAVKIFFCYAHEDEELLEKLKMYLRPFQRNGLIDVWYDRNINAGMEWEQEINKHLVNAQVILLLISPYFMDSDYCYGIEMNRALERHKQGEVRVIPIILRPIHWQEVLGKLQALPTDARPVIDRRYWYDLDEALFNVAEGIRKVVEELNSKPTLSLSAPLSGLRMAAPVISATQERNLTVIDLSIEAAQKLPSHQHPFTLRDLHTAYLHSNPGIKKGTTLESFSATINYYTINMRSRFPDANHKRQLAPWLSRPVFKRIGRGRYTLLSPEEVELFLQRVEEDDPRVYDDEYDINDLHLPRAKLKPSVDREREGKNLVVPSQKYHLYQLFFADLLVRLKNARPGITNAKKTQPQSSWWFAAGKTGFYFQWTFHQETLQTELIMNTSNRDETKKIFDTFWEEREAIEQEFGTTLEWERLDHGKESHIALSKLAKITDPPAEFEETKKWAVNTMITFVDVFQKRIKTLKI